MLVAHTAAWASIGKITALRGDAVIERDSQKLPASLGSALEGKDVISTGANTKLQITFEDKTIITVGKESRFSIEEYLFSDNDNARARFNVLSGTIRVMSGKIGKIAPEKFTVKTKTATIGIRGTNFSVNMQEDGLLSIFCIQGAINVEDQHNNQTTVPAGWYLPFSAEGIMGSIKEFFTADLQKFLEENLSLPVLVDNLQKNLPVLVDSFQKNLGLPRFIDSVQNNLNPGLLFSDTFDENTLPVIAADKSGGLLHPDESLEMGNHLWIEGMSTDAALYSTTDSLTDTVRSLSR